jgi:hypothetical protein
MRSHLDKSIMDPKYLATFLLTASVAKDVFAYSLRVHNAKKNPEIPDDKKPFVIAMDKATGITTIAVQLTAGTLIASKKFQNFCCDRLFADVKSNQKMFNLAKSGFGAISTLFGSVVLAKRVLVPLLATPMASHFMPKGREAGTGEPPVFGTFITQSKPSWFIV